MRERIKQILLQIDLEIDKIDLNGYDIIEVSLSMVHRLQNILTDLRNELKKLHIHFKRRRNILFQKPETRIIKSITIFSQNISYRSAMSNRQ